MSDTKVLETSFKDNQSTLFLVSRANKIASAIYLVTELFDDREPLRWRLRSNVLEAVDGTTKGSTIVSENLEQIVFMIETAARVRLLSEMNRDILVSEIRSFLNTFEAEFKGKAHTDARSLSDVFEDVREIPQVSYQSPQRLQTGRRIIIKGHMKGPIKDIRNGIIKIESQNQISNGNDRKEKIVNAIKQKGEITIKDIATIIPGCSEKTIQRDLADLVLAGTIKKKGERRWTIYFL